MKFRSFSDEKYQEISLVNTRAVTNITTIYMYVILKSVVLKGWSDKRCGR